MSWDLSTVHLNIPKTSTLLNDILKEFNKEVKYKTAEFEKNLQEEREWLLVKYKALITDTFTCKNKLFLLISHALSHPQYINYNKDQNF